MNGLDIDKLTGKLALLIVGIAKFFGKDVATKIITDIQTALDNVDASTDAVTELTLVDNAFGVADEFIPLIKNPATEAAVEAGAHLAQEITDSLLGGPKISTFGTLWEAVKTFFKARHAASSAQ